MPSLGNSRKELSGPRFRGTPERCPTCRCVSRITCRVRCQVRIATKPEYGFNEIKELAGLWCQAPLGTSPSGILKGLGDPRCRPGGPAYRARAFKGARIGMELLHALGRNWSRRMVALVSLVCSVYFVCFVRHVCLLHLVSTRRGIVRCSGRDSRRIRPPGDPSARMRGEGGWRLASRAVSRSVPCRIVVGDHGVAAFLGAAWRRRFDFPGFGPGGSPLGRSEAEADRGRGQASPGGQILWKIERRRLEAERNAATPRDQLRIVTSAKRAADDSCDGRKGEATPKALTPQPRRHRPVHPLRVLHRLPAGGSQARAPQRPTWEMRPRPCPQASALVTPIQQGIAPSYLPWLPVSEDLVSHRAA